MPNLTKTTKDYLCVGSRGSADFCPRVTIAESDGPIHFDDRADFDAFVDNLMACADHAFNPQIGDIVKVNKYAHRDDRVGRIVRKHTYGNGVTAYFVSSMNQPFCGSIDEWLGCDDFTIVRACDDSTD